MYQFEPIPPSFPPSKNSHIRVDLLRTADQLNKTILSIISAEQIIELAKENAIPHVVITNPATKESKIYFEATVVNEWFTDTCIKEKKAIPASRYEFFFFDKDVRKAKEDIPEELCKISNLYEVNLLDVMSPPGIYFLCKENKIVYIGQSINIVERIQTHRNEGIKDFDKAFFIICSVNNLLSLESKFIKMFEPHHNLKGIIGKMKRPSRIPVGYITTPTPQPENEIDVVSNKERLESAKKAMNYAFFK